MGELIGRMDRKRALKLARAWAQGHVCTLRPGEAQEYHELFASVLEEGQAREAAMEEDMRKIAMGYDACVYCAHCCLDGAPVYRSGERYLAFCETCDDNYSNFAWRGVTEREDRCGGRAGNGRAGLAGADPG